MENAAVKYVEPESNPVIELEAKLNGMSQDLTALLNRHGIDSTTNTPDYILALFITDIVYAYHLSKLSLEQHLAR